MSGDNDNTNTKKRKTKFTISYSNIGKADAEKRLGFRMRTLENKAIAVERMLLEAGGAEEFSDVIMKSKEKVYDQIVQCLAVEGYPSESDQYFKVASISDLVFASIVPVIYDFRLKTGRDSIQLLREKEVVAADGETGGLEEFVVVDFISVSEERYILVIEGKRSSLGEAKKQCLLAMKDMGDKNSGYMVYGFVTTGESWQMVKYDGASFQMSRKIDVLFNGMDEEKELWMKNYSVLVDCLYVALSCGGIVKKNVVVG